MHVTPAHGNIFADLGLPDAENLLAKSGLAVVLLRSIRELGLTRSAAAQRIGISQRKLSNILRGRFDNIGAGVIADCLKALGHDIEYCVGPRHEGRGIARVIELDISNAPTAAAR